MSRHYFPHWLLLVFCVYFALLAVEPVSRTVWIAEVIPVVLVALALFFPATWQLTLVGRLAEVGGVFAFVLHAWPRVKAMAFEPAT